MKDQMMDLERRLKAMTAEQIDLGKRENMAKIDQRVAKLDESTQKYYKRMSQLDIKATNTLLDVQGTNERFAKKVEEVTDRWMSAMGKEEKVRISLKAFNEQIQRISDSLYMQKTTND